MTNITQLDTSVNEKKELGKGENSQVLGGEIMFQRKNKKLKNNNLQSFNDGGLAKDAFIWVFMNDIANEVRNVFSEENNRLIHNFNFYKAIGDYHHETVLGLVNRTLFIDPSNPLQSFKALIDEDIGKYRVNIRQILEDNFSSVYYSNDRFDRYTRRMLSKMRA